MAAAARRLLPVLLPLAAGCAARAGARGAHGEGAGAAWSYVVDVPGGGVGPVDVTATFTGAGTASLLAPDGAGDHVDGLAPSCRFPCRVHYRVDVAAMAGACVGEVGCPRQVGGASLLTVDSLLARPDGGVRAPVSVTFRYGATPFIAGLDRAPGGPDTYAFPSALLEETGYVAYGPVRTVEAAHGSARITVGALPGLDRLSDGDLGAWMSGAAACVAGVYGRFPLDRFTMFMTPVRGRKAPVFGHVLTRAGASGVLFVGDETTLAATREDWVLVHELIHLGFPSFEGEGRWLGEGIATYYEPIARVRCGWMKEETLWQEFLAQVPRAVPPPEGPFGLEARTDVGSIYWGGAVFALRADVALREATAGRVRLEDVLRAVLAAGGDARHTWRVVDVMKAGDRLAGKAVLVPLYEAHAHRDPPDDPRRDLEDLGVVGDGRGGVRLVNDRPRSALRQAIVAGGPRRPGP